MSGFKTVIVLSIADLTIKSPSEFIRSVEFPAVTYSSDNEIGSLKSILYSSELPFPDGTSLTKSPLLLGVKTAEIVAGTIVVFVE